VIASTASAPAARTAAEREGADVVRAVVAATVDEEGRRAGDAAQVSAVDVLGDARGAVVVAQEGGEALDGEAQLLGVADKVVEAERVLMREQEVVRLPNP
jgi:hypothetical protein